MKKALIFLAIISCWATFAQVGINTTTPSAQLDIKSSNQATPANTDGLLIPKVDVFPATNPTAAQQGMMVQLTTATTFAGNPKPAGFYYWDNATSNWVSFTAPSSLTGWSTTGNPGTNPSTNFIGTTDNQNVVFKRNNIKSGVIEASNTSFGVNSLFSNTFGTDNIAIGTEALYSNNTRNGNIAIGNQALYNNGIGAVNPVVARNNNAIGIRSLFSNTLGFRNVANGYESLYSNTTGNSNSATGYLSLYANTTGAVNTATGAFALYSNTTGNSNTATGVSTLYNNTTGSNNTANGYQSLFSNTTGASNTANGDQALYSNTTGNDNVAIGKQALFNSIDIDENVAIGSQALYNITLEAGIFEAERSIRNTAVGTRSLYSNTTGLSNTGIGWGALQANTTGHFNTAIGTTALLGNSTGSRNVAIGEGAMTFANTGNSNTAVGSLTLGFTGNYNTALGYSADLTIDNLTNATAIGSYAEVDCSNCLVLGANAPIATVSIFDKVKVGIGTSNPLADLHIKEVNETYSPSSSSNSNGGVRIERKTNSNAWNLVVDNGNDLDFNYNGTTRSYIANATGGYITVSDRRAKKQIQPLSSMLSSIMKLQPKTYYYNHNTANDPLSYGFIAQEVEKIFPDFVSTKGAENMKAIAYQNFNVIAIKAIQEQQEIIESQNEKIKTLETINAEIIKRLEKLENK